MATQNRRRHRRAHAKGIAAHLQMDRGLTPCLVEDISTGGLFIRTARVLPLGMAVSMSLVRPGMKGALRLTGRVANISGPNTPGRKGQPGMGIQLDTLPGATTASLEQLLKELGVETAELAAAKPAPASEAAPDPSRLMIQIRGVLMELGEAQLKLDAKEKELAHLKAENEKLRAQLRERDERLARVRALAPVR